MTDSTYPPSSDIVGLTEAKGQHEMKIEDETQNETLISCDDNGCDDVDKKNEEEKLKRFACHCRTFYSASLSSSSLLFSKTNSKVDIIELHLSSEVLQVLEQYAGQCAVLNKELSSSVREELHACGLDETPTNLTRYMDVRNQERSIAHENAMKRRYELLLSYLPTNNKNDRQKQDIGDGSDELVHPNILTTRGHIRRSKALWRTFIKNYYKNIGSHSFSAGLKKFVQTQLSEPTYVVEWTFDSTNLSEQQDEDYIQNSFRVLSTCATYLSKNDEIDVEANTSESIKQLSWRIDPYISNDSLYQLVSQLPSIFDARPTGTCQIIKDEKRVNGDGQLDEWGVTVGKVWDSCDIL